MFISSWFSIFEAVRSRWVSGRATAQCLLPPKPAADLLPLEQESQAWAVKNLPLSSAVQIFMRYWTVTKVKSRLIHRNSLCCSLFKISPPVCCVSPAQWGWHREHSADWHVWNESRDFQFHPKSQGLQLRWGKYTVTRPLLLQIWAQQEAWKMHWAMGYPQNTSHFTWKVPKPVNSPNLNTVIK